ncbi:MAG: FkbM family methyltransferase [bacterium]
MNLKTIAHHTIDLDLLPLPGDGHVLDVGCRNFDFFREFCINEVFGMDPDPAIEPPADVRFLRSALVGDGRKSSRYASYSTGEGNMLTDLDKYYDAKMLVVPCCTIEEVMRVTGVAHWDVVKLDCEGSEFGILENWPGPIATQISVEFHDYSYANYNQPEYYEKLWAGPLHKYKVIQHELSKQGEGWGHWDTLLVLRTAMQ